jgi:5-methylcytosine-specific restriction enzyme A
MTPRREFSAATKRAAWERSGGICEGWLNKTPIDGSLTHPSRFPRSALQYTSSYRCGAPLDHGNFHYDHFDPDWYSKDNELENCTVLCHFCHAAKTRTDVKNIAKSKRIIDKRIKARKPKSRPLPGTRASGWKHKMSGEWVRRERW